MRVTAEEFRRLVTQALAEIPAQFEPYIDSLVVDVEPLPDARTLESVDLDDPRELLGYYHGTPLTERSVQDSLHLPERIVIYQRNLERLCRTKREIIDEIRTTVLHEIGHHFGLEEDDLDDLGYA